MGDTNLHGVLNMPPELWSDSELDKMQRHSRYVEASSRIEDSRLAIRKAVIPMMDSCGNSYANAWLEEWLTMARDLGAYEGEVVGKIKDLKNEWEARLKNSIAIQKRYQRN
jgi:hypothetical protein